MPDILDVLRLWWGGERRGIKVTQFGGSLVVFVARMVRGVVGYVLSRGRDE